MWSVGIVFAYMLSHEYPLNAHHLSGKARNRCILDLMFKVLGNPSPHNAPAIFSSDSY
jgi:hypothetical protein